jgi:hypothetical protein
MMVLHFFIGALAIAAVILFIYCLGVITQYIIKKISKSYRDVPHIIMGVLVLAVLLILSLVDKLVIPVGENIINRF